jgi:nucleoside-diphosphate-sugar epimerase
MNIFIPGGAGHIGIALADQLIASGHGAVIYDRDNQDLPPGARFVEGDVRDFQHMVQAAQSCDSGIHFAALSGASQAAEILSINVLGAYGFLAAARQAGFRNAVMASSAPVHLAPGAWDNGALLPTAPGADHVYDLSKALQEEMARDFHAHGLPALCLRFGHIVRGKEESDLRHATSLKDERYCRGGWVALEDVVESCIAALQMAPATEKFEVLNIVGARGARQRFQVAGAEHRLGISLRYDFAAFE